MYVSTLYLSTYMYLHAHVCTMYLCTVCMYVYVSVCLSIYLSIYISLHHSSHNTEGGIISSLFWDPTGPDSTHPLIFSSSFGHLGSLPKQLVYPNEGGVSTDKIHVDTNKRMKEDDPLIDDSLLMEVYTCSIIIIIITLNELHVHVY